MASLWVIVDVFALFCAALTLWLLYQSLVQTNMKIEQPQIPVEGDVF